MELITHPSKLLNTLRILGFDGFSYAENKGFACRIITAWKTQLVKIKEIVNNFQFPHLQTSYICGQSWYFTSVYVSPDEDLRKDLWHQLHLISRNITGGWLLTGDFNEVVATDEHKGGAPANVNKIH